MKEFASALMNLVPTKNWNPQIRNFGCLESWERHEAVADPPLSVIRFPLQRGYARFPIAQVAPAAKQLADRLRRSSACPEDSTLICSSPFYAPVAERWPGRVVYYSTDLTRDYAGMDPAQVVKLDTRMCRVAQAVCPNSQRIADYLSREAGCDTERITVIPNATRASNVAAAPLLRACEPPADLRDLPRPLLGVIGNFASNMDWNLLESAVENCRDVSWAFVGPVNMPMADAASARLRHKLTGMGGRVRFLGPRPYGQLASYARCFDAALIPYAKSEPTISGSATRFYEHLAACRPILANRAHGELLTKEPLLKLVDDGSAVAAEIERLRANDFSDGLEELRWNASRNGTWHVRARDLVRAVDQRAKRDAA